MPQAIARRSPTKYIDLADDVRDTARTNPEGLADSVVTLAQKKNAAIVREARAKNAMKYMSAGATDFFATLGALVVTGGVGWLDGKMEATREAMIAEWEAAGNTSAVCPPWELGVKDPSVAFWKI